MHEETLHHSLCWRCIHKDYDSKYNNVGQWYKDYTCDFTTHHHVFGTVRELKHCQDFESEAEHAQE